MSGSLFWQPKFSSKAQENSIWGVWAIQGKKNNQYQAFGRSAVSLPNNQVDTMTKILHNILSELPLRDTCYLDYFITPNKQFLCCEAWMRPKNEK